MLATVVEYIGGALLKNITGVSLWNYNKPKFFITFSLIYTGISMLIIFLLHPLVYIGIQLIPNLIFKISMWTILSLLIVDILASYAGIFHARKPIELERKVTKKLSNLKTSIGKLCFQKMEKRIMKSFPELKNGQLNPAATEAGYKKKFAEGVCFEKLVWMFLVSALIGDIIETIFVWGTTGVFMSRSSLIYGPFSVVWGLGGVIAIIMLHNLINKKGIYIFIAGFLLGGTYEYSCSVFTEKFFGTRFWDYSNMPFNLDGRVNLLFCIYWGLLAIIWIKGIYAIVSMYIGKLNYVAGQILTWCIIVFISLNTLVSATALHYYSLRMENEKVTSSAAKFFNKYYPNELMKLIYPNAVLDKKS